MSEHIPTQAEVDAMTPRQHKSLETRLRRAADRQGLRLVRSRRRDERALDYGTYWLVDHRTGGGMFTAQGLAEVAAHLWGDE
jgi:hypothetical protein